MKKKDRKQGWQIFQNHHAQYADEATGKKDVIFRISRTEHFMIGRNCQKYFESRGITKGCKGFLKWLANYKHYKLNKEVTNDCKKAISKK